MGTLAAELAGRKIPTHAHLYRAQVEGDVEDVEGVLRITRIRVRYSLQVAPGKAAEAREALDRYLVRCPAAMSVRGSIDVSHSLEVEESARAEN